MLTFKQAYTFLIVFLLGLSIAGFFEYQPSKLRPDVEKEGTVTTTKNYSLDIAGLQQLAIWQLCDIELDAECQCDCGSLSHKKRSEILEYAPGIHPILEIEDWEDPILTKINQHHQLARLAVVEFQSRFPIGATTLPSVEDVCVGLPRFNATMANILPWYDLFDNWDYALGIIRSSRLPASVEQRQQLRSIQSHLRHVTDGINGIFKIREDESFEQLVAAYEDMRCTESEARSAGPSSGQDAGLGDEFSVCSLAGNVFHILLLLRLLCLLCLVHLLN
ncbi:hypothetical protein F5B18DRAFT_362387 [Nemania serpens]|nr:hypothetical protein F5B18DRAFT_362387 [Nemania serpens]